MRYFKVIVYTTGEDFETRETLVDEPTFRQYQKAILEGREFLVLENKVVKTKLIKEILPADADVREQLATGMTLESLGLPENPQIEERYRLAPKSGTGGKYEEMRRGFAEKSSVPPEIVTATQEEGAKDDRRK